MDELPSRKARFKRKNNTLPIAGLISFIILIFLYYCYPLFISDVQEHKEKAEASPKTINISMVGDMQFSGHVNTQLVKFGFDYPFMHVKEHFIAQDMVFGNLETPITIRGVPALNKEYVYKSDPKIIPFLKQANFQVLNLANNHILDQGSEGLQDTFHELKEAGISYIGAGKIAEEAYAPIYVEKKGMTMAFLGTSRVLPETNWQAGKNRPGVSQTYEPSRVLKEIEKAKAKADFVFVYAHWGKEKEDLPDKIQVELAHRYIDAGADFVVGSHPHVLQGIEQYKGKWILYSLGNFIFSRSTNSKTWESAVVDVSLSKGGPVSLKVTPYEAQLGIAVPASGEKGKRILKRIQSISSQIKINESGEVYTNIEQRDDK